MDRNLLLTTTDVSWSLAFSLVACAVCGVNAICSIIIRLVLCTDFYPLCGPDLHHSTHYYSYLTTTLLLLLLLLLPPPSPPHVPSLDLLLTSFGTLYTFIVQSTDHSTLSWSVSQGTASTSRVGSVQYYIGSAAASPSAIRRSDTPLVRLSCPLDRC